jgi:hypothetical protein
LGTIFADSETKKEGNLNSIALPLTSQKAWLIFLPKKSCFLLSISSVSRSFWMASPENQQTMSDVQYILHKVQTSLNYAAAIKK